MTHTPSWGLLRVLFPVDFFFVCDFDDVISLPIGGKGFILPVGPMFFFFFLYKK